jgi:Ca2+-binding RTX toxin-like protein
VTLGSTTVIVNNVEPVIDSATNSGPINEGSSATISVAAHDAAGANDPLTITYDYGDGNGYVAGNSHTFADNGSYIVGVKVSDGDGGVTLGSTTVIVNNVAPTLTITGSGNASAGSVYSVTLSHNDPGTDTLTSWTINWGDGHTDTVAGNATSATHTYAAAGTFPITGSATDEDGTFGATGHSVNVTSAAVSAHLQSDPLNPGQQMLEVDGTAGDDDIKLTVNNSANTVTVSSGNVVIGTYSPTSRIVVFGGDGNDSITHGGGFHRAVELYGGAGNDTLKAGDNGDILVGGTGDDSLVAGAGDDLLIGGGGADKLAAGGGEDILIAGSTSFDNDPASLNKIMAEWQSTRTLQSRIYNLTGYNPNTTDFNNRLNGTVYLLADVPNATVFDDAAKDTTNGGGGADWFLINISGGGVVDKVAGAGGSAVVTDI